MSRVPSLSRSSNSGNGFFKFGLTQHIDFCVSNVFKGIIVVVSTDPIYEFRAHGIGNGVYTFFAHDDVGCYAFVAGLLAKKSKVLAFVGAQKGGSCSHRIVIGAHITSSRCIDMPINVPLPFDRVLTRWRLRRWDLNCWIFVLALPIAGSVDIFSLLPQLDIVNNIVHSIIVIVIVHFFVGCDDLLSRKIETVMIPVDFVKGSVKGTIENRMLIGGDFSEIFHTITLELNHQIATGAYQIGIGYFDSVVGRGIGIGT
mmetsp:Transcript_10962/g.27761  ORF Transcript_10962/g.27761 Transcript_10962/m.27761 type:complete len:257 (-) Transcript_10962:2927-3697(-)